MESPVRTNEVRTRPTLLMSLQGAAISSFPAVLGECQPIMRPDIRDSVARRCRTLQSRKYLSYRGVQVKNNRGEVRHLEQTTGSGS